MPKREFLGKTDGDVEIQVRDWANRKRRQGSDHQTPPNKTECANRGARDPPHGKTTAKDFADQFSMIVEYEIVATEKKRQPKRDSKRQGK